MDSMPAYLHLPNVNKLNNNNNNSHFNHHPSTIMSVSNDSDASNNTTNVINTTNNNNNSNDDQIETVKFNTNSTFALHQSVLDGRIKQIDYFLKMGLKVNSKDKYGRTALMLTCLSDHEQYGLKVAKLLIKRGADLNVRDSLGRTVMFIACSEKREKLFNYLMDDHGYSIDFRVKDNDGNVLLNHVALYGSNKMLKKVIEKMKEKHVELDHRNNSGLFNFFLS
jgi:ankyrin repeat protein